MFVNTGLILKADSEAELAGVLAHEIAHVAARHGTRQATRGQLINYASIPLIFMGGWAGYAHPAGGAVAVPMGFLKFSRGMETEADHLGLAYLYKTGYDPLAFVDFFERIETAEKHHPGSVARAFSSHPMTNDRIHTRRKRFRASSRSRPNTCWTRRNSTKCGIASNACRIAGKRMKTHICRFSADASRLRKLLLVCGVATAAFGQVAQPGARQGSIEGVVLDQASGAPLADATIRLKEVQHNWPIPEDLVEWTSMQTNELGHFVFSNLGDAIWELWADHRGYLTAVYGARRFDLTRAGSPPRESRSRTW